MRVLVTQARVGAGRLVARLRELGFEPVERPLVRIETIPGPSLDPSGYDWVVLTSARAVEPLLERITAPLPRVAVIGPGTAEALRAHGVEPAVVARTSTQEGLVEELPEPAGRVLFAGAEGARGVIVNELGADFVAVYRTVEEDPGDLMAADLVVLASGSAAKAFARLGCDLPCVSIGPSTSAVAGELGLRVVAEAVTHDLDGLVEAVRLAASALQAPDPSSPSSPTTDSSTSSSESATA